MKILYVASVTAHINGFHLPFLKMLGENGWEVHAAANDDGEIPYCGKRYTVPIQRSPYRFANIRAYRQLKKIFAEEKYDVIHCHTPVASILTRLAARKSRKAGTKVFYTAHGFHFFTGAPLRYWLLYYPIERLLSKYTDVLITINREDFERAKKAFKAKEIKYVPGVGIDIEKFHKVSVDTRAKRKELAIPENAIVLFSAGELNANKNHAAAIRALAKLKEPRVHYLIAGKGPLQGALLSLAKRLGLSDQVHLIGYRKDLPALYKTADICIHPSKREGLPVAVMEAMAAGLPCIVSKIRGCTDLIEEGKGGRLQSANDINGFSDAIRSLANDADLRRRMGTVNSVVVIEFDLAIVTIQMLEIYRDSGK